MTNRRPTTFYLVLALYLALLAHSARAGAVIGSESSANPTDATHASALGGGGLVTFDCGLRKVVLPLATHGIDPAVATIDDGADRVTLDGENG